MWEEPFVEKKSVFEEFVLERFGLQYAKPVESEYRGASTAILFQIRPNSVRLYNALAASLTSAGTCSVCVVVFGHRILTKT
jgi:hypothetical protein